MKLEDRNFGKIQTGFKYPHTRPVLVTQSEYDYLFLLEHRICGSCIDFYLEDECQDCGEETFLISKNDVELEDDYNG